MGDRRGQFDMAHPFAPDLLQGHLDTALLADQAAIFHALVFAAQAFVILDGTEDARAKQAVTLGLERAVVDGFGLLHLAEGPGQNFFGRGQRDLDFVELPRRSQRVQRIGGEFLVHLKILMIGAG